MKSDQRPSIQSVRAFNRARLEPPQGPSPEPWFIANERASRGIDLEIGCGVGWHPIQYALNHTHRGLIAIEHTRAKFEKFQLRFQANGRPENLLPVHADAVRWVAHWLKPQSIDRCFLLYPNPEPKAPNRRWFRSPFMHCLLDVLKDDAELTLASNESWYIEEALEWSERNWQLPTPEIHKLNSNSSASLAPRTHFEKKYLQRGETCFNITWRIRRPSLTETSTSTEYPSRRIESL